MITILESSCVVNQVKHPALSSQQFGSLLQCKFNPWPWELLYAVGTDEKEKKEGKYIRSFQCILHRNNNQNLICFIRMIFLLLYTKEIAVPCTLSGNIVHMEENVFHLQFQRTSCTVFFLVILFSALGNYHYHHIMKS